MLKWYSMKTPLSDTSPEIEQYQLNSLRKMSETQRLQLANSLTKSAWQVSWLGFCERYSELSLEQRKEKFVDLLYGIKISYQK